MIYQQKEISTVAKKVLQAATSRTLCFYGEMGAGKTTFIKELVSELGGMGNTSSPTFGIVNEYHTNKGKLLGYHFDFYRLNEEIEVLDLGFEDYLNQNVWVFIEWPEKIATFLPEDSFDIHIKIIDLTRRKISF